MNKCQKCGYETDEELIRGEICNSCSCKELAEENFVETDYPALKKIAKGILPKGNKMKKFKVESFANGTLSSSWEVEADSREEALEQVISDISDFEIIVGEEEE